MRRSHRGEVDPFIVMDVMEAARAAEARGRVGHPHGGRPARHPGARRRPRRARRAPWRRAPLGYTVALGLPELRARIARLYRDWYGVDLDPGPRRGDRRLLGRLHPRLHLALRARREGRDRRARLPVLPQHPARARPRARRHRHRPRGPLPAHAARPDARPRRRAGGEPGQPDRHHARHLRARRAHRARRRARPRLRLRRDLPRHPVRRPRRLGPRDLRRGLRHQLVLEVLLDDRLAHRLDGGARGARPPHRAAGAEPLHLRPARQPGRGAGRPRRDAPSSTPTSRSTAPTAR